MSPLVDEVVPADALAADSDRIDAEVARIWVSREARAALASYAKRTLGQVRSSRLMPAPSPR